MQSRRLIFWGVELQSGMKIATQYEISSTTYLYTSTEGQGVNISVLKAIITYKTTL